MRIIKSFFDRLSGSLLVTVPSRIKAARDFAAAPVLRLVSDKRAKVSNGEAATKRPHAQATGQLEALEEAIRKSQSWFLARQDPSEGYWVAELEADTTLTSEYLMLRHFMGCVDPERETKAVRYLKSAQLPDGGWPIHYGGPSEISASVKAYFALKLSGVSPDESFMVKAKECILAKGGVTASNVFTKIALALFGQYDWRGVPSMPPEIMLLPRRFYFSIYAISYWSRAVLIPLLIIFAKRPLCAVPKGSEIDELYVEQRDEIDYSSVPPFKKDRTWFTARNFFINLDGLLKIYDRSPVEWIRQKALKLAERWMLDHMKGTGGLGAIYPAMANSVIALHCLGYRHDDPLIIKAMREIEELEIHDYVHEQGNRVEAMHLQPCHSPIWDTALLINALVESGMPQDHPALQRAANWLVSKQTTTVGDWIISSPGAEPGGWYFQFENEAFTDVDDSAVVLMALAKVRLPDAEQQRASIRRGCRWVVAMQGSDGGWGAYDKDNNRIVFNYIPFADHRALLDPSTADLAGRCLEMLATLGYDWTHPCVASALAFLKRDQERDGSWYGRWGVNYIYGTWSVLAGLRAIGEDPSLPYIRRAVAWIESKQNPDGGWGESCLSYADVAQCGRGDSTPSQTAWALLALMSAGVSDSFSVARGIHYLIRNQRKDGSWEEIRHTGTGFPRVFYLRYHWYSQYFPLWALAMYRNLKTRGTTRADELRLQAYQSGQFRSPR
jgi:squalene-hopene/tetraprenyl-beta-curcumene cyclase